MGRAFESDVHQIGYDDIIIMMPEGNFVKVVGYGKFKECLSAIPGTKETTCLSWISTLIKTGMENMQSDTKLITEILEIRSVSLVWNVIHYDMRSLNRYLRFIDTRTLSHKPSKHKGILATRKGNEDAVVVFQKIKVHTSLIKPFKYQSLAICHKPKVLNEK